MKRNEIGIQSKDPQSLHHIPNAIPVAGYIVRPQATISGGNTFDLMLCEGIQREAFIDNLPRAQSPVIGKIASPPSGNLTHTEEKLPIVGIDDCTNREQNLMPSEEVASCSW